MATATKKKPRAKAVTDVAPKMKLSIIDAMNDEALFASWYRGPSWDGWKAGPCRGVLPAYDRRAEGDLPRRRRWARAAED